MRKERFEQPETEAERNERYARAARAEAERKKQEQEYLGKYKRMVELADQMGPRTFFERGDHIGFTEWSEALNFQDLCREINFPVRVVEPRKPASSLDDYFKVYPG